MTSNSNVSQINGWYIYTVPTETQVPKEQSLISKDYSNGCSCTKCHEHYAFAVPNQNDGTLICWSCRYAI